jgi:hypothetical protein
VSRRADGIGGGIQSFAVHAPVLRMGCGPNLTPSQGKIQPQALDAGGLAQEADTQRLGDTPDQAKPTGIYSV